MSEGEANTSLAGWRLWLIGALILLVSSEYAWSCVSLAASSPYWMDEVLAVWTARLKGEGSVWTALVKGAEFSPPLFHWLLQKIIQAGAHGPIAMRMPSILAGFVVGGCAFAIANRRFGLPAALLAFTISLSSGLVVYAVQARPYALVAASFSLAVWVRDGAAKDDSPWRGGLIALLLSLSVGLHVYAILLVATLGLVEGLWTLRERRLRWWIAGGIVVAAFSILIWTPVLRHAAAFNHADVWAPEYYGKPTALRLLGAFLGVLIGHLFLLFSPLIVLLGLLVPAGVLCRRALGKFSDIQWVIGGLCLLPATVFVFSLAATHTFNERYVISAALGFALLGAACAAGLRLGAISCSMIALVLALGMMSPIRDAVDADQIADEIALVKTATKDLPLVTGNGRRFFELSEGAPSAGIIYLKSAPGSVYGDPTNEHQVERWETIDPLLKIAPIDAFLAAHPDFLMISSHGGDDVLPKELKARRAEFKVVAVCGPARLTQVHVPSP